MPFRLLPVLLVLLCLVLPAAAANRSAEADFEAGLAAFRAGEYFRALDYFERAERAGMTEARLDYNLGAVHYRLANYDLSRRYYEKLRDHPQLAALAYYNLGLIAHKDGDRTAAIAYFEKCAAISEDQNLAALAEKQIATLGGRRPKSWFAYLSAVYGYDSNITLRPTSSAADESGDFVQTLALGELTLGGDTDDSYELTWLLLATDYLDGGDLDDELVSLGLERRLRAGRWRLVYGLEAGKSTFGGEDYDNTLALSVGGRTGFGPERELRLDLSLEDIDEGSSDFAFLAGTRAVFNASYRIESGDRHEYRFEYGLEVNDRENTETESFSPTRHRFRLRYFHQLDDRNELGAGLEFRDSDYRGVSGDHRRDERSRVRLEHKFRFDATWGTQAEVTYTDNDSNESESSYHKYQARVSVNLLF